MTVLVNKLCRLFCAKFSSLFLSCCKISDKQIHAEHEHKMQFDTMRSNRRWKLGAVLKILRILGLFSNKVWHCNYIRLQTWKWCIKILHFQFTLLLEADRSWPYPRVGKQKVLSATTWCRVQTMLLCSRRDFEKITKNNSEMQKLYNNGETPCGFLGVLLFRAFWDVWACCMHPKNFKGMKKRKYHKLLIWQAMISYGDEK